MQEPQLYRWAQGGEVSNREFERELGMTDCQVHAILALALAHCDAQGAREGRCGILALCQRTGARVHDRLRVAAWRQRRSFLRHTGRELPPWWRCRLAWHRKFGPPPPETAEPVALPTAPTAPKSGPAKPRASKPRKPRGK